MVSSYSLEYLSLHELVQAQPHELFKHSYRVAQLAGDLAQAVERPRGEQERIELGSLLHDIGKQFIPAHILEKRDQLSTREYHRVQQHAWLGYAYLNSFVSDAVLLNTVLYHHERWDGCGYPYGLKAEQIPLGARICSLADVWDALTTDRCYRPAWGLPKASEYIWSCAGSFFDPSLAHQFLNMIETQGTSNGSTGVKQVATLPLSGPNESTLERLPLTRAQGGEAVS